MLINIHSQIYNTQEKNIGDVQFGFRNGFGTRESMFSIQVLIQKALDMNCDVYKCFIDVKKTFDKIDFIE